VTRYNLGRSNPIKMTADELKTMIGKSLLAQGFCIENGCIASPDCNDKDELRRLHASAVQHKLEVAEPGLRRFQDALLKRIACGSDLSPTDISPRLVEVMPGSEDELLFRFVRLHWTIPVSAGYGRRLRFLVVDDSNDKLIGILGLGDPVFSLGVRDRWIGWNQDAKRDRLRNVLDAFILGSVPPYSHLLGSKLVAMLAASDEVRLAFARKYSDKRSIIRRKVPDSRIALITTLSALGRSSVYNRVRFRDRALYESIGFSVGSGEFHFSNGIYSSLFAYAQENCEPTAKKGRWGTGFRNRREVVRKCLLSVGLPDALMYHGVQREVFGVPLARNAREFLRGEHSRLQWHKQSASDLFLSFRERWLLPRAARTSEYRDFDPKEYRLWT
jgi:hypothetical protein